MSCINAMHLTAPTIALNIMTMIISACVFLYICFRCIGITNHRKTAFILIAVTSLVFDSICTALMMLPSYNSSLSLQLADYMVYMFKTFIILAVIATCAEGYLPRNFIVIFLYCDLLTTIPFMPHHIIHDLLLRHYGLLNDPSIPGGYASPLPKTAANTIAWAVLLLTVILACRLFNRYLIPALRRIPDIACLLFLLTSFVTSVIKSVILLKTDLYVHVTYATGRGDNGIATSNIALILMMLLIFIIVLMLTATVLRQQTTRIIDLENAMLLDYYNNVSSLHSSIRSMRHDLSNHLAALSFMSMGESAADPDRQTLMSTSGATGVPGVPSTLSASELSGDFVTPGISAVPGAARAPGVSDRAEAPGDFSPAEAPAVLSVSQQTGGFDKVEVPGGCTPPVDPGRCAEASRRELCGAGSLRAPDDPGRCATGVPGDAFCGYSTPVMPGDSVGSGAPAPAASSDPRDAYRRSLLNVCNEIDRQIAAQTAWQQIDTNALSSREKYEIYHYVTTVMQKHRIPVSALCITTETGDGSLEITLKISTGNNIEPPELAMRASDPASPAAATAANTLRQKALRLPLLRHGTMFRLIKLIAQSHGGDAVWKKYGDGYALVVRIRQLS